MLESLPADFKDLLVELSDAQARFLVVGGYAVAVHGHPRATKDLDVWVEPTKKNGERVFAALVRFGAPIEQFDISPPDFEAYDGVLQLGVPPVRIDILTRVGGVTFEQAWLDRLEVTLDGRPIPVLGLDTLIVNKRHTARPQDLADVHTLEQLRAQRGRP
jgi:predicted nucleotidyltransferase